MSYKIDIPEPCSATWKEMTKTENGRFCESCEKEVLDFTQSSKATIFSQLQSESSFCGRFTQEQLETSYSEPGTARSAIWKAAVAVGLSVFLPSISPAQNQSVKEVPVAITERDSVKQIAAKQSGEKHITDSIRVSGRVVDSVSGEPLIGATVQLENTEFADISDVDGFFMIIAPPDYQNSSLLTVHHIGYHLKEITYQRKENEFNTIQLTQNKKDLTSVVVVGGAFPRPSLWQRFKNLFRGKKKHVHTEACEK